MKKGWRKNFNTKDNVNIQNNDYRKISLWKTMLSFEQECSRTGWYEILGGQISQKRKLEEDRFNIPWSLLQSRQSTLGELYGARHKQVEY